MRSGMIVTPTVPLLLTIALPWVVAQPTHAR